MTNCLMNDTYTKMQERLLQQLMQNKLQQRKAFTVCCDTVKNEFFFIERIDSDAVITNNNKYKDYISLWDYQIEQLSNEGVEWIRRLLDRDNILIVTKCNNKEDCIKLIKELEKVKFNVH